MHEVESLSVRETAESLELTESNVKVRLLRARKMLQENLSGYYSKTEVYSFHLDRCSRIVEKVFAAIN